MPSKTPETTQPDSSRWVTPSTTLFWFRRDLRLEDNAGLFHALKENRSVLPFLIFDTEILDKLEDPKDRRVEFIHYALQNLKAQLEARGSNLLVLHGNPVEIFTKLTPLNVYTNHDYEPYARSRDEGIAGLLASRGIAFKSFKDQVIFEKDEIIKDDGSPYTIFTPYSRKWKSRLAMGDHTAFSTKKYADHYQSAGSIPLPSLKSIGFEETGSVIPDRTIRQAVIAQYDKQRDFPGINGTSRLSAHLRFGTVSIRQLVSIALKKNETWLNELIWREFYHMILWHFPHVVNKAFKPAYDNISWRNDPDEFEAWCEGRTGYPIVDAGMRELNATGFMHNRSRMIVASFLTKHLLIDWRWGEAYFAKKLLDFDLAANNGGWQWAAGSGCDAAPYFRVFSPDRQTEKFDPQLAYVRKWVSELGTPAYPKPIVNHTFARERVLKAYKTALENRS